MASKVLLLLGVALEPIFSAPALALDTFVT